MRAQSSIEMLIMVAFGLILLVVIAEIIFSNLGVYYGTQQQAIGTQSLSILASEIDDVYFSGPGTTKTIRIEIPNNMDLANSYISGNNLVMNLNGSEYVVSTRVPIRGTWPNSTGAYTFKLTAYGDFVAISADLLDFNPSNIAISLGQGSSTNLDLNIQNLSGAIASYELSINFSGLGASVTSTDVGEVSFLANDYNQITLSFSCSTNAIGNYDGNLFFDGADDVSIPIKLVCEAGQSRLSVYPSSKDFNQTESTSGTQTFQVCNSSNTNYVSSSSSVSGAISSYAFTSFSSSIAANTCESLTLNVNAPATSADTNIYLGTLTVEASGFTASSDLNLLVTESVGGGAGGSQNYYFASVLNNDLNHWFNYEGWIKQKEDNNWIATGELDWNKYEESYGETSGQGSALESGDTLFNANLEGLWHLDLNLNDSSGNGIDCSWVSKDDDENTIGLWDSNAVDLDGTGDHISCGTTIDPSGASTWTMSAWAKNDTGGTNDGLIGWYSGSGGFFIQSNSVGEGILVLAGGGSSYGDIDYDIDEDWVHIVAVYDGTQTADADELVVYLNGSRHEFSSLGSIPDTLPSVAGDPFLIGRVDGLTRYWDGQIEEVAMWNDALTANEVLELYNSQKQYVYDSNLIAYYDFEGNINDNVGTNNGTLEGSASTSGGGIFGGNALTLSSSTSDYVSIPSNNRMRFGKNNFAIGMWVFVEGSTNAYDSLYEDYDGALGVFIQYNPGLGVWANGWDATTYDTPTHNIGDDKWHYVVFQRTGATDSEFYVDGYLVSEKNNHVDQQAHGDQDILVGMLSGYGRYFDGRIDELKIYNRALTANEILSEYQRIDQNLIAYYKFNDTNGGAGIYDSARGHNGTLVNTANINAKGMWDSNALELDGDSDYVPITDSSAVSSLMQNIGNGNSYSISAWIKTSATTSTTTNWMPNDTIICLRQQTATSTNAPFSFGLVSNKLFFGRTPDYVNSDETISGVTTLNDSDWHHVAFTVNVNDVVLYVDGEVDNQATFTTAVGDTSVGTLASNLQIGARSTDAGAYSEYFHGLIDEVKIYDKELSATEIAQDYNRFLEAKFVDSNIVNAGASADWNRVMINSGLDYSFGRELGLSNELESTNALWDENLIGVWHLNETSGDAIDSKGTNDGTITGGLTQGAGGLMGTTSYEFFESGDMVSLGNTIGDYFDSGKSFTVSTWVNQQTRSAGWGYIWNKAHTSHAGPYYKADLLIAADGDVDFTLWGDTWANRYLQCHDTTNLTLNKWEHIVTVYDATEDEIFLYRDGVEACNDNTPYTTRSVDVDTPFTIARNNNLASANYSFDGRIEEVLIWDRNLGPSEISSLYNSQKSGYFGDGLVGLWHLNDNNLDSSGNGYDGTWVNTEAYVSGLWNTNAGTFTGSGNYMTFPSLPLTNASDITVSVWAKKDGLTSDEDAETIVALETSVGYFRIEWSDTSNSYYAYYNDGSNETIGETPMKDNEWYHLVYTKNSNVFSFYVNGELKESETGGTIGSSTAFDAIGSRNTGTSYDYHFDGDIEEVIIWNKALSLDEIGNLYRKGVSSLDLNIYNCDSVSCTTKSNVTLIEDVNNNSWMDIPAGISDSQYLGYEVIFGKATGFGDHEAGTFWTGAYLQDVNISYST